MIDELLPVAKVAVMLGVTDRTLRNFANGVDGRPEMPHVIVDGEIRVKPRQAFEHLARHARIRTLKEPPGLYTPDEPALPRFETLSIDLRRVPYEDSNPHDCYSLCESKIRLRDVATAALAEDIGSRIASQLVEQHAAAWSDLLVKVIVEPIGLEVSQIAGESHQSISRK